MFTTPRRPRSNFFRPTVQQLEDRLTPALTMMTNFAGLAFPDSGGSVPPDTHLAVGQTHVLETVNTTLAIFNKANGAKVSQVRLNNFFAPLNPGPFIFDPVVVFDDLANRFIVAALDVNDSNQTAFIELGVSNTADPTKGFAEMQKIPVKEFSAKLNANLWGDYPKIGYNADAITFSLNMFSFPTTQGKFDHVQIVTVNKALLLDGNSSTGQAFSADRTGDFTMAVASAHDAKPGDPVWFVEALGGSFVRVVKMTNELSNSPTFANFNVQVSSYGFPAPAPQPNGGTLDTGDTRMLNVELRGTRLVSTHTVGLNDNRSHVRFYEFNVGANPPTLTQQGTIDPGPGISTWSSAIGIGIDGSLGLTYIESPASEFFSMYVATQGATDPRGSFVTAPLRGGQASYSAFDGEAFRSGDYSGLAVDPATGNTFWAANEFATNANRNNWGTFIGQFSAGGFSSMANQVYVQQVFQDLLQRQADLTGLAAFTNFLNQGGSRADLVRAFTSSQEFRTVTVRGYYQTLLRRQADTGGLNALVAAIAQGATLEQVQVAFVASNEYFANRGGSNSGFIDALYLDVLGRPSDQGGKSFFLQLLTNGMTRAQVASLFYGSAEYQQALVRSYYLAFLRRQADTPGLNFLAGLLRNGTRDEAIIGIFVSSQEYANRLQF